jgi:hypothetical protein
MTNSALLSVKKRTLLDSYCSIEGAASVVVEQNLEISEVIFVTLSRTKPCLL